MTHRQRRRQAFDKAASVLLAVSARARSIRKFLSAVHQRQANREAWVRLHEAKDLAAMIEAVASKAADSNAEDAETMVDVLEILEIELDSMVKGIPIVRS